MEGDALIIDDILGDIVERVKLQKGLQLRSTAAYKTALHRERMRMRAAIVDAFFNEVDKFQFTAREFDDIGSTPEVENTVYGDLAQEVAELDLTVRHGRHHGQYVIVVSNVLNTIARERIQRGVKKMGM